MSADEEAILAKAIGAAITKRRLLAGYTLEAAAEAMGMEVEAVSRVERGGGLPSLSELMELGELYGCPVEDFLSKTAAQPTGLALMIVRLLENLDRTDRKFVYELVEISVNHLKIRKR